MVSDGVGEQRENNGKMLGGITGKGFMPGQSGNPKGRPRGTGLTDRLRAIVEADNAAEELMQAGYNAAKKGDFRFWQEILNRLEGKVPDRLVGDDNEAPLRFTLKCGDEEIDLGALRAAALNGSGDEPD